MIKFNQQPPSILMVCLGNICRSPLAEGIFKKVAADAGFVCKVDSAGTGGWHQGEPPHLLSQKVAWAHGITISLQKARKLTPEDLDRFDLIFCMDHQNLQDTLALSTSKSQIRKVSLLLEASYPRQNAKVPDPYYGNYSDFENVYHLLYIGCTDQVKRLLQTTSI